MTADLPDGQRGAADLLLAVEWLLAAVLLIRRRCAADTRRGARPTCSSCRSVVARRRARI